MSIFNSLKENLFKIRVIPKRSAEDKTSFTNDNNSASKKINDALEAGKRVDLSDLTSLPKLSGNRNQRYEIFEEMVADGRIGAAIEMYANDTVQYNSDGNLIWVESDESDVAEFGNTLLEDLNIAENLWSYAYCLWLYGDVYLKLFTNTSVNNSKPSLLLEPFRNNPNIRSQKPIMAEKLERYIEKIPNPADVYDLQYKGKTSGFIYNKSDISNSVSNNIYCYSGYSNKIDILSPTSFIHICLSPNINRFPEEFRLIKDIDGQDKYIENTNLIDGSDTISGNDLVFQVKSGQSVLENVYGAYNTLKLKEDSVLLERVTRSSITRIIQVELGDLPESQKRKKLRALKDSIEQQLMVNKETNNIESRSSAQPMENILYTSTKNGKGAISSINIGGDGEIGNLDDINQSENKLFGSLLTPKASLGADMDGTGLSNGGSLTELNTTYARRIKRGQVAICSAIKTLINIFALDAGPQLAEKVVNNFEVKLTPIITVEDNRRDELLQKKINNVNDIISLLDNIEMIDEDLKLEMLISWLSSYLNQQDIVDILNSRLKKEDGKFIKVNDDEDESIEDEEEPLDMDKDMDIDKDININKEDNISSFPDISKESSEEKPIPHNTDNINLTPKDNKQIADIEGEDLL